MLIYKSLFISELWAEDDTDLVSFLGGLPHIVSPVKEIELFGPHRLKSQGSKRCNEDVAEMTHAVLDFDSKSVKTPEGPKTYHISGETTYRIIEAASQYRCAVYSTFSHEPDSCRFRVVFDLPEPVAPNRWRPVWDRLVAKFADLGVDRKCKDVSRAYYLPSCPPHRRQSAFQAIFDGPPIDLSTSAPLVSVPSFVPVQLSSEPMSGNVLAKIANRWKGSTDYRRQHLGERLSLVKEGVAFAQGGERSDTLFALICELVREVKNLTPEVLVSTFHRSLDLMKTDAQNLENEIPGMFERAKGYLEQVAAEELEPTIEPLQDEGLAEIFKTFDATNPMRALVLQRDSEYYVLSYSPEHGCRYIRTNKEGLPKQCAVKLKPFRVNLTVSTGERTRRMTPEEIVAKYGTPVEDVVYSFIDDRPKLSKVGARHELVQPAALIREELVPEYNEEVDQWLRMLGGAHAESVLDWVAFSTDPSKALVALVLIGAKSTGKSLLAKSLARIWTQENPPKFKTVLDTFNDDLLRCPLVFADEDLPRDWRGRVRTAEFRDFLQEDRHSINAKYRARVTLRGYPRLIVSANNEGVLDFGSDNLTQMDLEAIQERLFVLQVPESCTTLLAQFDIQDWLTNNRVARHALFLAEHRMSRYKGRFGLQVASSAGPLLFTHGIRSQAVEWVVKHVLNPTLVSSKTSVLDTKIRVFVSDIEAHWNDYLGTSRPTTPRLASALAVFGGSRGCVEIPLSILGQWIREFNYVDNESFARALAAFEGRKVRLHAI